MLQFIGLILIAAPLIFQIVMGRKAIGEDIRMKFGQVCLLSFALQVVLSIAGFFIFYSGFVQDVEDNEFRCGMPLVGLIFLILIFSFLLFLVMIIQFFIKRRYDKFS